MGSALKFPLSPPGLPHAVRPLLWFKGSDHFPRTRDSGYNLRRPSMGFNIQIERAVQLLNEDSSHTVAELASRCTLSISRLSHLFRAHTGVSVGRFRLNCRLEQAKRMLATDMS